ncbi:MAG: SPOR domain-containing protein [Bacteroidales bacterium]
MNIPQYLSELLYQRESIILPGFGEFRTTTQPAGRNASGKLMPPSRTVSFNPSVKANDYVLARVVSEKLNSTILKGNEAVRDYVEDLLETLEKKGRVTLPGIGEFVQANNLLTFNADESVNYDISSFGLEPASAASASHPEVSRETEIQPDAATDTPQHPGEHEPFRKKRRWLVWIIVLLLLLLAGAAWVWFNQDKATEWYTQCTAYFSDKDKDAEDIAGQDPQAGEPLPDDKMITEPVPDEDTATTSVPEVEEKETSTRTQPEKPMAMGRSGQYAIIAGCFGDQKNAEKMVGQLQSQGFSASIEGKTSSGLFRVSAGLFPSAAEARNNLKQANEEKKLLNAWVLRL